MNKHFLFILLFASFSTALCAQDLNEKDEKNSNKATRRKPKPGTSLARAAIGIQANHDFYLTIDNVSQGKVSKDKSKELKLVVGNVYKLLFEEADSTGETIQQFIRVTPDMMKRGDSVITVTFNNDYLDIIQPNTTGAMKTEGSHTALDEQEVKNKSVAMELSKDMILKPGGSFKTTGRGGGKEQPPQTVTVRSLNVGRHEVTQRQWQAVMGFNNSANKDCPDCPVENVSRDEVSSFIEKLNKGGLQGFRLPTGVEWEYVAKKSIEEEEGSSIDPEEAKLKFQAVIKNSAWYNARTTQPVGQKKAIAGVFDLLGNVAEWCVGEGEKKVIKGGSYKDKEEGLLLSLRNTDAPADKQRTVGFRLVTDAE